MRAFHLQPVAGVGATPRLGHQVLVGSPHREHHHAEDHFHKALQVGLHLEPGSNLFTSNGRVLFCFVPLVYFCTDSGFLPSLPPVFFVTAPPLSLEVINASPCGGGWVLLVPMVSGAGWFAAKHCSCWRDGCDHCGSTCPKSYADFVSLVYRSVELAAQHQRNWVFQKFVPSIKGRLSRWHGAGRRNFLTYMEVWENFRNNSGICPADCMVTEELVEEFIAVGRE